MSEHHHIVPHILCGGSGTRLWPVSRESFPKQFCSLIEGKSLLTCTLERSRMLGNRLVCIANEAHRFLVDEAAVTAGVKVDQLLEPIGKNTAPAMACAALRAQPDDLLLFLPADHYIPDAQHFAKTIQEGVQVANQGYIVTFGVVPTYPATGYGYIHKGSAIQNTIGFSVQQFVEKPEATKAQDFILSGQYLWNAGIFLVKAQVLVDAFSQVAEDILLACKNTLAQSENRHGHYVLDKNSFEQCQSESIDYAVLEKFDRVAVIPFTGGWSDVGNWNAVAELCPPDTDQNRIEGNGHALHCQNVYISESTGTAKPVVALGLKDIMIVDTPDALLVANRQQVEQVKDVVQKLKLDGATQAVMHRKVARPWGTYDSIDMGERYQVKRITVKPGAKLSLQMHHHRAEHWIVVKGTAKVTKGDEEILLCENQSTYIPLGVTHRLENVGKMDLEMIEVQSGSYLGEDDIVRFEDVYGRSI